MSKRHVWKEDLSKAESGQVPFQGSHVLCMTDMFLLKEFNLFTGVIQNCFPSHRLIFLCVSTEVYVREHL